MPTIKQIQAPAPNVAGQWGYDAPCTASDVERDIPVLLKQLSPGQTLHVLTGVHGFCGNDAGGVATRDVAFAIEDFQNFYNNNPQLHGNVHIAFHQAPSIKSLESIQTDQERRAAIGVANKDLNDMIRMLQSTAPGGFLLAYCCSAGSPTLR
jgi:hypothetical protein